LTKKYFLKGKNGCVWKNVCPAEEQSVIMAFITEGTGDQNRQLQPREYSVFFVKEYDYDIQKITFNDIDYFSEDYAFYCCRPAAAVRDFRGDRHS
jgi:hypothetical protein